MAEKKLYFITNSGCDDETNGLVELDAEQEKWFFRFIDDLNKNSIHGCQPMISVIPANRDDFVAVDTASNPIAMKYIAKRDRDLLYLNGEMYTYAPGKSSWNLTPVEDETEI